MKRYIYSEYIMAMAVSKDDIIEKMKGRRKKVAEHLAKCAMYGDGLGSGKYNHWIEHELATWISDINDLVSKPKNKKLKPDTYAEKLFGALGDSKSDAKSALIDLQLYNDSKQNKYPYVEIDEEMVGRMHKITQSMLTKIVPILATKNSLSKEDIENLLHSILDPICKGIEIW